MRRANSRLKNYWKGYLRYAKGQCYSRVSAINCYSWSNYCTFSRQRVTPLVAESIPSRSRVRVFFSNWTKLRRRHLQRKWRISWGMPDRWGGVRRYNSNWSKEKPINVSGIAQEAPTLWKAQLWFRTLCKASWHLSWCHIFSTFTTCYDHLITYHQYTTNPI